MTADSESFAAETADAAAPGRIFADSLTGNGPVALWMALMTLVDGTSVALEPLLATLPLAAEVATMVAMGADRTPLIGALPLAVSA